MEYKLDPKEASNIETIKIIERNINKEIEENPEWWNSLSPGEKTAFVYQKLGFDCHYGTH